MKYLKNFKVYESAVSKPVKKFPTEPAAHWNYLYEIVKDCGLDPYELQLGNNDSSLQDFFFEFCSKNNVVFPNFKDSDGWSKLDKSDVRYEKFIFGESVFQ